MRNLSKKTYTYIIRISLLLIWLIFGSSVSILSPTNESLGVLFALLSFLFLSLGLVIYIKVRNIKVKNPKPLFVEPSIWIIAPLVFIASGLTFLTLMIIITFSPLNPYIINQIDKGTFIGGFAAIFIFFFSIYAPIITYGIYVKTHYKQVIRYRSTEWKEIKAKNKTNKL